ncbi:MAG: phytoene desaturase family protein [Candidatus Dormibacteria bacterium]
MTTAGVDVAVVGAGPNGLAAAILVAEAGFSVHLIEAADEVGGSCRTSQLTLPGFHHDVCAAVLPFARLSPFFRHLAEVVDLPLVSPQAPLAHPWDDGPSTMLERDVAATAAALGADAGRYRLAMGRLGARADSVLEQFLGPLHVPRHPVSMALAGAPALLPAAILARALFRTPRAQALLAGLAAHSMQPLDSVASAGVGMVLALTAHTANWPVARGGTQTLADLMGARLRQLGGVITTGQRVRSLRELPPHRIAILDLVPRDVLAVSGDALGGRYARRLRGYRHGPGIFKVDWALAEPIPWRDPLTARAATVHVGGTLAEIAGAERTVVGGGHPDAPFVILAQPTLFDETRAPSGRHVAWGYCHVPNGSRVDMTARIEAQLERFAPGFGDVVLARSTMDTAAFERHDANIVGGDINGGAFSLAQMLARPAPRLQPCTTPNPRILICSAATPPGGGVHGMGGWWAARAALRRLRQPSP